VVQKGVGLKEGKREKPETDGWKALKDDGAPRRFGKSWGWSSLVMTTVGNNASGYWKGLKKTFWIRPNADEFFGPYKPTDRQRE